MARTRRIKAAAKRSARKEARQLLADAPAKLIRFAYHSASKDEITVRTIDTRTAEVRTNRQGGRYLRAYDMLRADFRNFTPSRIGWMVAA